MTISTTSATLTPGQLDLATQISTLQTALAANTNSPAHAPATQAKIKTLQENLVHTLMATGRVNAALIVSTLGLSTTIDPVIGAQITARQGASNPTAGDNASQITSLQIQAVANAMKTGAASAASILSQMT